jgi:hypothetical protein
MQLSQNFSVVKFEIETQELFAILQLLSTYNRKDLVKKFLIRLYVEEYLTQDDVSSLATHYGIAPISLA